MLEKAKNRKFFYFLFLIILGLSLCIPSVFGAALTEGPYYPTTTTGGTLGSSDAEYNQVTVLNASYFYTKFEWIQNTSQRTSTLQWSDSNDGSGTFTITYSGHTMGTGTIEVSGGTHVTMVLSTWDEDYTTGSICCDITYSGGVLEIPGYDRYTTGAFGGNPSSRICYSGCSRFSYGDFTAEYYEDEEDIKGIDLDVSPTSGASPLAVSFTDQSFGFTEGVDTVLLTYGDGNSYSGTYPGANSTRNYIYLDAGTYNYSYKITSDGDNFYHNGTVTVTGDSTVNFAVYVHALNGSVIGDATVNIWYDGGTVTDSELTDDFYGTADFYVEPSRYVNGNVTKTGYYTSNFTYYVCPTGYCSNEQWITLYTLNETPGTGDEFGNYLVTFKDAVTGEEVGYSNIEVYSDSGYTTLFYDEYSNALGVWTGLIPMDVIYYYKYPETTSYYSQTWSYNLTSSPSYKTVNLIPKSGATSTPTPTPTTTYPTVTPYVTYTYNDSNLSELNVKERMTNLLVLAGFQNTASADLVFAMIIVLGCTALMGWITLSGSGAGIGAIIGFVFSLGLGLLPIWLLIAAVFLGGIYLALKLFGGTGE